MDDSLLLNLGAAISNYQHLLRMLAISNTTIMMEMNRMDLAILNSWSRLNSLTAHKARSMKKKKREHKVWSYERSQVFINHTLIHSYDEKMFKARMRVSMATFDFLCKNLGEKLRTEDTIQRKAIPVATKVVIGLTRLATGTMLSEIADKYGVGVTTAQRASLAFCRAMQEEFGALTVQWPSEDRQEKMAKEFEDLKKIPYVVGAIDGSHIPIISPKDPQQYYNRKGFHSVILQLIVSAKCLIWDYDFGWAGSCHDWTVFQRSAAGKRIMEGYLGKYALVGDAAYPPRLWMFSPFKGSRDGLERWQKHWNYAQ